MRGAFWHIGTLEGHVPHRLSLEEICARNPEKSREVAERWYRNSAQHCPPPVKGIWVFESTNIIPGLLPHSGVDHISPVPVHVGYGLNWTGPIYTPRKIAGLPVVNSTIESGEAQGANWIRWDSVGEAFDAILERYIELENRLDDSTRARYNKEREWIVGWFPMGTVAYDVELYLPLDEGKLDVVETIWARWDFHEQILLYEGRPVEPGPK